MGGIGDQDSGNFRELGEACHSKNKQLLWPGKKTCRGGSGKMKARGTGTETGSGMCWCGDIVHSTCTHKKERGLVMALQPTHPPPPSPSPPPPSLQILSALTGPWREKFWESSPNGFPLGGLHSEDSCQMKMLFLSEKFIHINQVAVRKKKKSLDLSSSRWESIWRSAPRQRDCVTNHRCFSHEKRILAPTEAPALGSQHRRLVTSLLLWQATGCWTSCTHIWRKEAERKREREQLMITKFSCDRKGHH